jgi:hypothetical protein
VPHEIACRGLLAFASSIFAAFAGCGGASPAAKDSVIVVSPRGTDTATGSASAPFRTLERALAAARAGDTIRLEAGEYSSETGEDWGYTPPTDVTITGDAADATRLVGPTLNGAASFVVRAGLKLEHLELSGFEIAIEEEESADLTLESVTISSPAEAAYGISLHAGTLTLDDSGISGGHYGIYQLAGKSRLRRTELTNYGSIGLYLAAGSLDLGTATEAGDNAFSAPTDAAAFGLYVDTGAAPISASDTSFNGFTPPAGAVQADTSDVAAPGAYLLTPGVRITFFRVH